MRAAEAEAATEQEELVLPTGSIIEAVVLTGMDAPTNQGTRRDPFPALLRFKKEAILPSKYLQDVRECFLLSAGYGDMSSERVFLRGQTISCGFEGGVFAEGSLDSYAVGEDGKAGVRGRLVSKDGVLLSRALLAGFAEGVSKAFDIQVVPVVNTDGNASGSTNVQSLDAGDAMRTGALGGFSTAMEKLADRYLELADQVFPVVELDAGRVVTFVLTRPMRMNVPKSG
jgi:conjugal transfer pilus assembly protein TraB